MTDTPAQQFSAPEVAATNLRQVRERLEPWEQLDMFLEAIQAAALASAAPDMALNNMERFLAATPDAREAAESLLQNRQFLHATITLFAGSQFLSDVLIAQPEAFHWLMRREVLWSPRSANRYLEAAWETLQGCTDRASRRQALSRWRRREMMRIGTRDLLSLATLEEVARDISDLAQAIIHVAAETAYREVAARHGEPVPDSPSWETEEREIFTDGAVTPTANPAFATAGMCVLGMGKLGGRELNFSSDIDLIFVYEAEGETTGRLDGQRRVGSISNHLFFTRMGELLVKFLSERGPEGNLFRVDMRLRPDGQHGPLVRSLESFITYLNSQARDWERLAYLKARVMSGPSQLAERLYRVIAAFVFSGVEAERIVREVQELKLRIDREVIDSDLYHREVKRGYGGIREIEFVISAMQIIHGQTNQALRVRNAFLAIQRLQQVHVLSDEEAEFYLEAYSFLRTVEHRLQMAEEHQTHTLPSEGPELEALSRRCGFPGASAFMQHYRELTEDVHQRFVAFFSHDIAALDEANRDLLMILDRECPTEESAAALARQGLDQPEALRLLHSLAYGTREVFIAPEGQRFFAQMLPSLLRMTAAAPRPERVLPALHSFAMAIKGTTYYYEVIANHPDILKMLVTLFGTSEFYSQALISHPEYFDSLISGRMLTQPREAGQERSQRMRAALQSKLPGRRLVLLRRVVHFENLLAALHLLLKLQPLPACLGMLSDTADAALEVGMRMTAERLLARTTTGAPPVEKIEELLAHLRENFCILGLGKYGGRELNFFGDLDVIFVFQDKPHNTSWMDEFEIGVSEFFNQVADTLNTVLTENLQGGRAYQVDARLRPHGRSAPHATPFSQYLLYIQDDSEVWELQAFSRSRAVWGTSTLWEKLNQQARERRLAWPAEQLHSEIVTMRRRLEEAAEVSAGTVDIKRGPGGLVDIEFLLQALAIGPAPALSPNYFTALQQPELITAIGRDAAARLYANYYFLRSLEAATRLLMDGANPVACTDEAYQRAITKVLEFGKPEDFTRHLETIMNDNRATFDRFFSNGLALEENRGADE